MKHAAKTLVVTALIGGCDMVISEDFLGYSARGDCKPDAGCGAHMDAGGEPWSRRTRRTPSRGFFRVGNP